MLTHFNIANPHITKKYKSKPTPYEHNKISFLPKYLENTITLEYKYIKDIQYNIQHIVNSS